MIKNCINTFFSSVFRVLGRFLAYAIVGVVFYLLAGYLGLLSVHAQEISYQQIFSTDSAGTLTTLDGLMTYDIGVGVKFTYYQFHFTNTTLEKGKTYHVKINLFGTLSDGFYQFDKTAWEFWATDSSVQKKDILNVYDLKLTGSGQYRSIEFDFYNATDYRSYRLASANPDGMLYYQYNGQGKFGWYSFSIDKINDSSDVIINQNDTMINQNQQIIDKQQGIIDSNKDINDTLKNEDISDIDFSLSGIEDISDTPVSDMILLPINLLNKLNNSTSTSCTSWRLPWDFSGGNNVLELPCIKLEKYLGSDLVRIIDDLICIFMTWSIIMSFVSFFNDITGLRDTYDSMYQPKHAYTDYKPKHVKE